MKKTIQISILSVLLALSFSSTSSQAKANSGSGLRVGSSYFEHCKDFRQWNEVRENRVRFNQCAAYALGVLDTFQTYATYDENTEPFCVPSSVNTYRLLMEVLDGLEARVDELEVSSALIIMLVIRDRFPCPK